MPPFISCYLLLERHLPHELLDLWNLSGLNVLHLRQDGEKVRVDYGGARLGDLPTASAEAVSPWLENGECPYRVLVAAVHPPSEQHPFGWIDLRLRPEHP